MSDTIWKPGDFVFCTYSTPFYGRVIGIKQIKNRYSKKMQTHLRVQKLFGITGLKMKSYRTQYDAYYCKKISQSDLDAIASQISSMLKKTHEINKKDNPVKLASQWK